MRTAGLIVALILLGGYRGVALGKTLADIVNEDEDSRQQDLAEVGKLSDEQKAPLLRAMKNMMELSTGQNPATYSANDIAAQAAMIEVLGALGPGATPILRGAIEKKTMPRENIDKAAEALKNLASSSQQMNEKPAESASQSSGPHNEQGKHIKVVVGAGTALPEGTVMTGSLVKFDGEGLRFKTDEGKTYHIRWEHLQSLNGKPITPATIAKLRSRLGAKRESRQSPAAAESLSSDSPICSAIHQVGASFYLSTKKGKALKEAQRQVKACQQAASKGAAARKVDWRQDFKNQLIHDYGLDAPNGANWQSEAIADVSYQGNDMTLQLTGNGGYGLSVEMGRQDTNNRWAGIVEKYLGQCHCDGKVIINAGGGEIGYFQNGAQDGEPVGVYSGSSLKWVETAKY